MNLSLFGDRPSHFFGLEGHADEGGEAENGDERDGHEIRGGMTCPSNRVMGVSDVCFFWPDRLLFVKGSSTLVHLTDRFYSYFSTTCRSTTNVQHCPTARV